MSQSYPQAKYQSLTRRRGSASAHDPLALHPDQPVLSDRQAMSRLTIVRVNPEDTALLYGAPEGSPDSSPRSARMSLTPPHSPIMRANTGPRRGSGAGGSPRLSFASSSFAHEPGSGSPPRSPKELRRRHSGSGMHVVRHAALTPQQVVDLAKSSVRPPPKLQRHPSAPALLGRGRDAPTTPSITPATFIPIPASQLLPFIDRPGEVTTFISTPPTSRLMALLEQAFPIHLRIRSGHSHPPPYTPSRAQSFADELAAALRVYAAEPRAEFNDPENWSYATLIEWMCTIPRTIADDAEWVRRLRTCVMAHSEQICVTLLSALGVPMEGVDEVLQPKDKPLHQNDSTPTIESPTALRPGSDTPTADHPHRSVVTTPPTILEDTLGENEDAFRLSISAILSAPPEPVEQTRAWSDSGSSSSSRGRGRIMEAIGESEDEEREADDEEEQELEIRRGREPRSGIETARSGSPAVGAVRAGRVVAADSSGTDSDGELDEDFPDLFGLSFATVPRGTGGADVLPSLRPEGAFPVPITTSKPPKGGARVAHVLSGAPGHAGYTWRPGGPLFARSFGGDESASEDEKVPPLLPRAIFDIKRPSLRQRSRSRDARKAVVLVVPPNTPINGLAELADAELLPFETLTVS